MTRGSWGKITVALLSLWVLTAHVQGEFGAVRIKLVRAPLARAQDVALSLSGTIDIPDPFLAFVYRVRNTGAAPVTISVQAGNEILQRSTIPPGSSKRVDLSWRRRPDAPLDRIHLHGTSAEWILESAELANLHGFTRGAVEFAILPAGQPLTSPPVWALLTWIGAVLVVGMGPPARWRRHWRAAHIVSCGVVIAFLGVVALAPVISSFRVVLAPHTFAGFLVVLAAPALLGRAARVARWLLPMGLAATPIVTSTVRAVVVRVPWLRVALLTAFVAYGAMLWTRVGAYAAGADSSGYLHSARLISDGRVSTPVRALDGTSRGAADLRFIPLGFRAHSSGELTPTYPIGLPLMMAAAAQATGWQSAADMTMVLHALAGVLLTFWLARENGLSPTMSALAALLLAASPLYLFLSLQLMSDTPALVWTTAAVLFAWRSRRQAAWAVLAGVAVSVAVLVRPANIVIIVPVLMCLGISPRRWLWLAAGGAPAAVFLVAYNIAAYGAAVATGYSADITALFGPEHLIPSLQHYVTWLPVFLTPIGVLALGLPALRSAGGFPGRVLMVWPAVFLLFYACYSYTHQLWWFLRFILPAFPPMVVAAVSVGAALLERSRALRSPIAARLLPAALALGIAVHNVWWSRHLLALDIGRGERKYFEVAEWTRAHVPPDAALLALQPSGALFYYTDFPVVRWDYLKPETFRQLTVDADSRRQPLYAVLFPHEMDANPFRDFIPGRWVQVGAIDDVKVWRFQGHAPGTRAAADAR